MIAPLLTFLRLIRIRHWIKNGLVLVPVVFIAPRPDATLLLKGLGAFGAFSFAASAIYVINDWNDRERDRAHPTKRFRPLASGAISGVGAILTVAALALASAALGFAAHSPALAALALFLYVASNVAYSVTFKNTPLADIFVLAIGFVLRIFYGGFYFGVPISPWLYLCVFFAALYFVCGKRKSELRLMGDDGASRPVLKTYTKDFLNFHYYMFCALTIVFYSLWTVVKAEQPQVGKLALTIPFLIFILVRYNWTIETPHSDGDPVSVLFKDRWLCAGALLFVSLNLFLLYFGRYLPRIQY